MKRLSRDTWLALGLLIMLLGVVFAAAVQRTEQEKPPPLASFSSEPDGSEALRLWLQDLGYQTHHEPETAFRPPDDASLLLMLEPSTLGIDSEDWSIVDAWVKRGGTLLLAGDRLGTEAAFQHFGFRVGLVLAPVIITASQTPLFLSPSEPIGLSTRAFLIPVGTKDLVTHVAMGAKPVIVSWTEGKGRVILSATAEPFTNAGLKQPGRAALALNLISAAGQSGSVWIDEWHHGVRADQPKRIGPGDWLRYSAGGRALLLAALLMFVALLLRGRHFGRSLPVPTETARRAPMEYITAVANLGRRAGHRPALLHQYSHWLKRSLGKRYRLSPTLPDDAFVAQLARYNPGLDSADLANLLASLSRDDASEGEMVRLAAETADWIKKK